MKYLLFAVALMLAYGAAFAGESGMVSGTNQATGQSAATIAPGAVQINSVSNQPDSLKTSQQAPSLSFSSSFSPDSCANGAGGSVGTFPVAVGINIPVSPAYCVKLRVYERLQQGAAVEKRGDVADELRDASYEVLGQIDADVQAVLVKHMVIADPKQEQRTAASNKPQVYAVAQTK